MSELRRQVEEFHEAFGHPTHSAPAVPPDDRVRFRLRFILEETLEAINACCEQPQEGEYGGSWKQHLEMAGNNLMAIIGHMQIVVDLPELVDALADIDYVVEGTRLEFGVEGDPIAREVHRSNMAKVFPDGTVRKTTGGKTAKPEGWTPPDIARCLREQGWK